MAFSTGWVAANVIGYTFFKDGPGLLFTLGGPVGAFLLTAIRRFLGRREALRR